MGPQEMLDRAEVKNKWQLTPLKNFKSPRLPERMWRTALVVLVTSIIYKYPLEGRNPCFALGADSAIQPGIVIYFVVMFTVGKERVFLYIIARILDTGFGVLLTLLLYVLHPSKHDKANGVSPRTFWAEIKNGFHSYRSKNRTMREKERENFGTDDDKNFSTIVSKIKKR